MFLQNTIRSRTIVRGVGLHSGQPCSLNFVPAPANSGVHFVRSDLPDKPYLRVHAHNVSATGYATTLGGAVFSVSTIEHCLSALSALRIDNLIIELEGPEIPIIDGSSLPFLHAIQKVGIVELDQPRKYCYMTESVEFTDGEKSAKIIPYHGLRISVTIDFPHPLIGVQSLDLDINEQSFSREIAGARTFGFFKDVEDLHSRGLGLGGSLDNVVVLDDEKIMNPEGLRFSDEFVRHKALDALGDLVTLGMPLMGHLSLYKVGHDVMNKLIRKIIDSPQCYRHIELGADIKDKALWKLISVR